MREPLVHFLVLGALLAITPAFLELRQTDAETGPLGTHRPRVAGSWIVAIGLRLLGWSLRSASVSL